MKLKTLKDFEFEQITDVKPDGYKGNAPGRKRIVKRKCVFSYQLKQEAIKWVKDILMRRSLMPQDWLDFFNITEEDLK